MGKTIIGEEAFSKIIEQYNSGGKTAAYDYLRSEYGIKLQIAAYYGRFCGAKRPQCEAERPGFLLI